HQVVHQVVLGSHGVEHLGDLLRLLALGHGLITEVSGRFGLGLAGIVHVWHLMKSGGHSNRWRRSRPCMRSASERSQLEYIGAFFLLPQEPPMATIRYECTHLLGRLSDRATVVVHVTRQPWTYPYHCD